MGSEAPSIAVVGPGAIGGAVAGALIENGHRPALCVRTGGFDRLVVEHSSGVLDAAVDVVHDPAAIGVCDVVILAVKAHQTEGARAWLDATVGSQTMLAVLQNGVEHRERLAPMVDPSAAIVPTIINLPAQRPAPGRVTVGAVARLTLEAGPGAAEVAALFDGSFITADVADDWLTPAWTKLVLNAASGGICTLTRTDNLVFTDPDARELVQQVMAEVVRVGRADGADLAEDLPERVVDRLMKAAPGHRSSIVVDRVNGVATEWDARNAVVLRKAAEHGIEVPLNQLLTTLIRLGEPS